MTGNGPANERDTWADIAKGASIFLVVLYHADPQEPLHPMQVDWLHLLNQALVDLRMPLFFAISGYVSRKILDRPFAYLTQGKLVPLLYVYVLWSVAKWFFFIAGPHAMHGGVAPDDLLKALSILWDPYYNWYLYVLAMFSAAAFAFRRTPPIAVLALAVLLHLASYYEPIQSDAILKFMRYFVWYAAGLLLAHLLKWAAAHLPPYALAALSVWIIARVLTLETNTLFLSMFFSATGIILGVAMSSYIASYVWSNHVARLGRLTLPVYVAHIFPVFIVQRFFPPGVPPLAGVITAVLVGIGIPIGMYMFASRFHLRWLFRRPDWLQPRPSPVR